MQRDSFLTIQACKEAYACATSFFALYVLAKR